MTRQKSERAKIMIIHGYVEEAGECMPGEEIIAIILIYRGRRYWIPWGPTHLILIDFLCRHRWIALDAWQIASRIQEDPFVVQHGSNATGHHVRPARTSRANVRQQVKRSRDELAALIAEEHLDLDARDIIRSEKTSTGTVRYRIYADVTWKHLPRPGNADAYSDSRFPWIHPAVFGSTLPSGIPVLNHDV